MDHILFEKLRRKRGKRRKLWVIPRDIFLLLFSPTEGWMTIKLCMRYLNLQGLDLTSNCFMKLSTWWVFREEFVELWRGGRGKGEFCIIFNLSSKSFVLFYVEKLHETAFFLIRILTAFRLRKSFVICCTLWGLFKNDVIYFGVFKKIKLFAVFFHILLTIYVKIHLTSLKTPPYIFAFPSFFWWKLQSIQIKIHISKDKKKKFTAVFCKNVEESWWIFHSSALATILKFQKRCQHLSSN